MTADNINKLKEAFIQGSRSATFTDEKLEKIAQILTEQYVNKGKKFTTKTVTEIITQMKMADYSQSKNPEAALKTAARKVLIKLGVIETKSKGQS